MLETVKPIFINFFLSSILSDLMQLLWNISLFCCKWTKLGVYLQMDSFNFCVKLGT